MVCGTSLGGPAHCCRYAGRMRRLFLAAVSAAALASTLTACGGDSSEASSASVSLAGSESATAARTPSSTTRSAPGRAASSVVASSVVTSPTTPSPAAGKPPADRVVPGEVVSGEGFLRTGSDVDYRFAAGGGRWVCDMTRATVVCSGELAPGAQPKGAGSVELSVAGAVTFPGSSAPGDKHGPARPKELPTGRSLPNGVFVCAAFAGGVQCETPSAVHGFKLTATSTTRW